MKSLENASSKPTDEEIKFRQKVLGQIIEEARAREDIINENFLLMKMKSNGFPDYTRMKLYTDRFAIDSQNNYIRHFLPRYSRYQEDIANRLDWMEDQCMELFESDWMVEKHLYKQTKDGEFHSVVIEDQNKKAKLDCIKTLSKVVELKQKHCEGQNIQIAAVVVGKELTNKKKLIKDQQEEIKQLKIASTRSITDESEEKK